MSHIITNISSIKYSKTGWLWVKKSYASTHNGNSCKLTPASQSPTYSRLQICTTTQNKHIGGSRDPTVPDQVVTWLGRVTWLRCLGHLIQVSVSCSLLTNSSDLNSSTSCMTQTLALQSLGPTIYECPTELWNGEIKRAWAERSEARKGKKGVHMRELPYRWERFRGNVTSGSPCGHIFNRKTNWPPGFKPESFEPLEFFQLLPLIIT